MKTQWKILPLLLAAAYAYAENPDNTAAENALADVVVTAAPALILSRSNSIPKRRYSRFLLLMVQACSKLSPICR